MNFGHLRTVVQTVFLAVSAVATASSQSPRVLQIDVDHVIHPLTVEIITQGLKQAEDDGAAAVIIRLDTPGGLLKATQQIIQQIIASPVPVITYVGPSGGRAASAGFMILLAGDIAAMAPATNTGAAHPVILGGGQMDDIMKQKVENDAAAGIRAVAEKRGRNIELAQKAVLESTAFTEKEALDSNLIDLIENDVPALIKALDGRTVKRFDGAETTLNLAGATVYPYELTTRQRLLLPLVDPNLAFILLLVGAAGIYLEFSNPGLILPGVAGGILVILGAMALSLLPINWAGVALIILGVTCFVLEATITSHGILALGGSIAMVLGAVMLVDTGVPQLSINWGTAVAATIPFALITVFLLRLAIKSFRYKVTTGSAGMVGEVGVARTEINHTGRVFVHGEWWSARSERPIAPGSEIRVVRVDGLTVLVEPTAESGEAN